MSQIKRNEGTRESKTFTRRGLQAEHQGITRQKQKILRRSRIRAKMTERKQCGFFERFRQGLEGEGAGAVREAEQEERRRGGRDGGCRRGVTSTSSFIIIRTVADTVRFLRSGSGVSAREKIVRQASCDTRRLQDCKPKANSLPSFCYKNLFFNFFEASLTSMRFELLKYIKTKDSG